MNKEIMKRIYILFLILGLLFISACTQTNKEVETFQDDLSTLQKTVEQPKEKNDSLKTLIFEKDNETNIEDSEASSSFVLSKNKKNIVSTGDTIILSDLIKYSGNDQIIVSINNDFYEIMEYEDMEIEEDNTYNITLTAPSIAGNYQVILVEYPNRIVTHTYFNLTVLDEIKTQDEAFQVANKAISLKINVVNITSKKINLIDNKWHVNLTVDYSFGCCSVCGPEEVCIAMCVSCGTKTVNANYLISNTGIIEEEKIKEIACNGNDGVWFRDIIGNDLCYIDLENLN